MDRLPASILVTGGHYSITTLLGAMLAKSPAFHLVHEPLNLNASLSFRTVSASRWFEFHHEARYPGFRAELLRIVEGEGVAGEAVRRALRIRSLRDVGRVGRFLQTELPRKFAPRPAILKAPILSFTARTMQRIDGVRVILGLRHPCAWVESSIRRDGGFDFANLLQPPLLEALPDYAGRIERFGHERQSPLHEAVLFWQVVQTFHARYLLGNSLTAVCRQEELIARPRVEAERLFGFCGVEAPAGLDAFIAGAFGGGQVDHVEGAGDYLRRDTTGLLQKWRTRLTSDEQSYIRQETSELAAYFGYREEDWQGVPGGHA